MQGPYSRPDRHATSTVTQGNFSKTLIYGHADFVLSVTAQDFDRDGDMDVASASFFDGFIRWYENLDGAGLHWRDHTIYIGSQGHYVSNADLDGDGDADLVAVTHSENKVQIFRASTSCDSAEQSECCAEGFHWSNRSCVSLVCAAGTYALGKGTQARCAICPPSCSTADLSFLSRGLPSTCLDATKCQKVDDSIARCACPVDHVKSPATDACVACPSGQNRPSEVQRTVDSLGNYSKWEREQGVCVVRASVSVCPLGTGGKTCAPCKSGTFNDEPGKNCKACPPGTFSGLGAAACTRCKVFNVVNDSSVGAGLLCPV